MAGRFVLLLTMVSLLVSGAAFAQEKQEEGSLAVIPLKNAREMSRWWGSEYDPAAALTDAITTRFANSKRFITVDRTSLNDVLREQRMSSDGMISTETAIEAGQLIGARYIVTGTVTEFAKVNTGGGGALYIPGINVGIGGKGNTRVRVTCELKVIDSETGMIVSGVSSSKEINTSSGALAAYHKGYAAGGKGGETDASGLGKALYQVADDLVSQVEKSEFKKLAAKPELKGYVIGVDGNKVFINLTKNDKVVKNSVFKVKRPRQLKDPKTGAVRNIESTVGEIKVLSAGDEATECVIVNSDGEIEVNDVVIR